MKKNYQFEFLSIFQIEIFAYITNQNILGIEYINILNSAIKTPECMNQGIPPTNHPPGGILPPAGQPIGNNPVQIWWWIILSVCLGILFIIIIFVGIYCLIDNRRSRSHDCANK